MSKNKKSSFSCLF